MLPIQHPLAKTAIDLRRSLVRLKNFIDQNPTDEYVTNGTVHNIISDLREAKSHIPKELNDDNDN